MVRRSRSNSARRGPCVPLHRLLSPTCPRSDGNGCGMTCRHKSFEEKWESMVEIAAMTEEFDNEADEEARLCELMDLAGDHEIAADERLRAIREADEILR